ncbi:MAG TPA: uracil-DNA glycosylase [Thermoanaerobaculia bacterium]
MARRFDRFVAALAAAEVSERACNQYSATVGDLRANAIRRANLRRYLEEFEGIAPDTLLIGEAPSYRGGRLTGIAFVSETLLLSGIEIAGPRGRILGAERGYRRATSTPKPSTEASATMVWGTIRSIEPLPLLWNAFPFHPFHHGNAESNRVPSSTELAIGQPFIEMLLRLFPIRRVVAIGNQASLSLTKLGIEHVKVRHPSQGGKNLFVAGMANLSQGAVAEVIVPGKSQIQQIKEGRAMRERVYNNRNQPSSPKAPLPTKNAVRLSTVPSSAAEKFNGGRDE